MAYTPLPPVDPTNLRKGPGMTEMGRLIIDGSGYDGAPGVNVLHFCAPLHGSLTQELVDEFYSIIAASIDASDGVNLPSGVTLTINPVVTVHQVESGNLSGIFTTTEDTYSVTGSGGGQQTRANQIGMRWLTNDFRNGRRVQGRTFYGPISTAAMDSDGSILDSIVSGWPDIWSGAYDGLSSRLIVWTRPKGSTPGEYADVVQLQVSQMPFILRDRR